MKKLKIMKLSPDFRYLQKLALKMMLETVDIRLEFLLDRILR